jgi:uncharacterized RDD family membrane protein YckC
MSVPPPNSPDSPYAPPRSRLDAPPTTEQLATTGQRVANYVLDYGVMVVVYVALGLATGALDDGQGFAAEFILSSALFLIYYATLESLFGVTVGKLVTGVRVVSEAGSEPSFAQILGRSLARMIPLEPLSLLGGKGRPIGWHDSLSGTRVIRTR